MITNTNAGGGDGVDVQVLRNNTVVGGTSVGNGGTDDFDMRLGELSAGDTIYVAVGPKTTDGADSFALDFSLEYVPLPTSIAVADYRDDFQGPPAAGWSYLWNENGEIGTAANYSSYTYNGSYYDFDGVNNGLPDAEPSGYGNLGAGGGHPGRGSGQAQSGGIDRYVIAGYTISEAGVYEVTDSYATNTNSGCGNGIAVRLYVNDTLLTNVDSGNGSTANFDMRLGALHAGDTVYGEPSAAPE